ncbi:MAG: methyltransferase domain-containing protein [Chloroflexi bacterium]|nr:methyltransferase domain-containing protein [Chloroflexota bacterium]
MTIPAITDPTQIQALVDGFLGWYHRIQLPGGIVTPGSNHSDATLAHLDTLGLPQDCTGLRVLDISCRDGFFTFELEKRGAEVVGIDYVQPENTGFPIVSKILGSKATYQVENIYNLSPEVHGTFDIVLFLGLLYHLRNPLLAIDHVRSVTKPGGKVFVETHLIDNFVTLADGTAVKLADVAPTLEDVPLLQFYPGDSLLGDHTNKFGPNMAALKGLFYEGQFDVQHHAIYSNRGYLMGVAIHSEVLDISRRVDQGIESPAVAGKPEAAPRALASDSDSTLEGNFWKISDSSAAVSAALDLQSRQWQGERKHLLETVKQAEDYAKSLKTVLDVREQEAANFSTFIASKDADAQAQHDYLLQVVKAREDELQAVKLELQAAQLQLQKVNAELEIIQNSLAYKIDQRIKRLASH